ncbi:MAG: PaaI family thioesterase [Vampirovibrionales bacterium]|nr:PaaI family thioesterase [Vampirovibrionales bacterium]
MTRVALTSQPSLTVQPIAEEYQPLLARIASIPAIRHLGMVIQQLSPGKCVALMPRPTEMDGIYESYHGGLLTTAADMAACFAVLTQTPAEQAVTTTDLTIRFIAPCLSAVTVEATVIKLGRTLCPVDVRLTDDTGKLVAIGMVTYMRLPHIPHQQHPA